MSLFCTPVKEISIDTLIYTATCTGDDKRLLNETYIPGQRRNVSHVTRKPVTGVFDQVRLKPACSPAEISWRLEISAIASRGIILSSQRTTKVLIRLRGCAG